MLFVATSAAAEPADDTHAVMIHITELTISSGGGIDPTLMRRAFDDTIDAAYRCYDSVKSKPTKRSPTVTLKFRIDGHGAVVNASAVGLPGVDNCLAKAIKELVLNTPDKGAMGLTAKLSFHTLRPAGLFGSGGSFASLDEPHGGLLGNAVGEVNGGGLRPNGARASGPLVALGQPGVQGDLDKAIIRRYIKRNIDKIQHCYEKQLLADPWLAGMVRTQFTIGGDGKVTSSTGAGIAADLASCVAAVIQHIEFPKPTGNGVVKVSYPFVFSSRNSLKKP
jgi:hypothetical protein